MAGRETPLGLHISTFRVTFDEQGEIKRASPESDVGNIVVAPNAPPCCGSLSSVALDVRGLTKHFDKPVLDGLDLTVRVGEFYALLGPNGAGKTTTLRIVAGLLRPDAGSVSVFGNDAPADPVAARRRIAWVPDEPPIYEKLTPYEYLEFVARRSLET